MIDYAKLLLPIDVGVRLLDHPLLSFCRPVNEDTGEVQDTDARCAKYDELTFTYYPSGRTTMHGSLHKYAHGHNWDEYRFTQFLSTVDDLCTTFDLDPVTLRLLQLEAGVNGNPPIPTLRTLQSIVCHRDGLPFSPMKSTTGRSLGLNLYRDQFGIKIYDKGSQYGLPFDLLRFEVKFIKSAPLHRMDIYTLNDLLNLDAWRKLQERVMNVYDDLFIAEPSIDMTQLSTSQHTFVTLATVPAYWKQKTRSQRHKARTRYADIVDRYATNDLKGDLGRILNARSNDLLNPPGNTSEKGDGFTNIPQPDIEGKKGPFHSSVNVGMRHPLGTETDVADSVQDHDRKQRDNNGKIMVEGHYCLTCDRDISDQKKESKYCSEQRYGKAGKSCRNASSNRMRDLKAIEQQGPLLFDHRPFVRPLAPRYTGNNEPRR